MFKDMVTIMHEHSGVHLQIGKAYPYLRDRSDMTINLVKQIKAQTDPDGLLNPGALGL
jgi:D-lactate dehydrogenase (cytochrome)